MPGLTYSQYVTQIAEMAVVAEDDANFLSILPSMILYAENRILRDLDLLFASVSLHGILYRLSTGVRNLSFPMESTDGSFWISEQVNLILPAGQTDPDADTAYRQPLTPTTKEFLDACYGSNLTADRGIPAYYCPFNENLIYVGPSPDQDYRVELVGTIKPTTLSEANPTTFISSYLSDLLIMASMVYISGYQRNFGRQSDDPQMAQSYESQYMAMASAASKDEFRKKYEASAWSSQSMSPISTPTRG
jgi:hypothetical protein